MNQIIKSIEVSNARPVEGESISVNVLTHDKNFHFPLKIFINGLLGRKRFIQVGYAGEYTINVSVIDAKGKKESEQKVLHVNEDPNNEPKFLNIQQSIEDSDTIFAGVTNSKKTDKLIIYEWTLGNEKSVFTKTPYVKLTLNGLTHSLRNTRNTVLSVSAINRKNKQIKWKIDKTISITNTALLLKQKKKYISLKIVSDQPGYVESNRIVSFTCTNTHSEKIKITKLIVRAVSSEGKIIQSETKRLNNDLNPRENKTITHRVPESFVSKDILQIEAIIIGESSDNMPVRTTGYFMAHSVSPDAERITNPQLIKHLDHLRKSNLFDNKGRISSAKLQHLANQDRLPIDIKSLNVPLNVDIPSWMINWSGIDWGRFLAENRDRPEIVGGSSNLNILPIAGDIEPIVEGGSCNPRALPDVIPNDFVCSITTVRLSKLYLRLHELPEFERFSFLLGRGNQVNHRLTLE